MVIRVLLAEDEIRVQNFVRKGLEEAKMTVDAVDTFSLVRAAFLCKTYDVLVLDRLLKNQDSIFNISEIKRIEAPPRIIILSAVSDTDQKVYAIDQGADDYLSKPFHIHELVARIRSLVRRNSDSEFAKKDLEVGDLWIGLDSHRVRRGEKNIHLSFREFKLLRLLASSPQKLFSRSELLNRVWDLNHEPESNVLDVTIGRLRRKLNSEEEASFVFSTRGVGYSLRQINDLA